MADIIVQPKVLASKNPDTYDNLIMAKAQNATTSNNGHFFQQFNSISDAINFISNNTSNYDCFKIDVILNQNDTTTVYNWNISTTETTYQSLSGFQTMTAGTNYSFHRNTSSDSFMSYTCYNGEDTLMLSFSIPLGIGGSANLLFRRVRATSSSIIINQNAPTDTFPSVQSATVYYTLKQ